MNCTSKKGGCPTDSVGAEIGVFKGEFTAHILRRVQPKELHLIDAWWLLYGENYPDWIVARLDRRNATVFLADAPES